MVYDIIRTRPQQLSTKKGISGNPVHLETNYFRLLKKPTWSLYQYHVDFSPEIEVNIVKKGLLRGHRDLLGGNIFDGSTLFLTNRLQSDIVELSSQNRNGDPIKITIKFTGLVSMNESSSVQILNIIMRKALEGLKLQLVGRNFFDAIAKVWFFHKGIILFINNNSHKYFVLRRLKSVSLTWNCGQDILHLSDNTNKIFFCALKSVTKL